MKDLTTALVAPFNVQDVKFKAQVVRGDKALVTAYVDARTVMDRLDSVCGVDGWQDSYTVLPNGSVICNLRLKIDGNWVEKADVGSPSEQPDEGDRVKAAFSDALKRAAVKLGIGRYLYRLPSTWVDYDVQRRTIKATPTLPSWAIPPTINEDQWKDFVQKCKTAGVNAEDMLRKYGLKRASQLSISQYRQCLTALNGGG